MPLKAAHVQDWLDADVLPYIVLKYITLISLLDFSQTDVLIEKH